MQKSHPLSEAHSSTTDFLKELSSFVASDYRRLQSHQYSEGDERVLRYTICKEMKHPQWERKWLWTQIRWRWKSENEFEALQWLNWANDHKGYASGTSMFQDPTTVCSKNGDIIFLIRTLLRELKLISLQNAELCKTNETQVLSFGSHIYEIGNSIANCTARAC